MSGTLAEADLEDWRTAWETGQADVNRCSGDQSRHTQQIAAQQRLLSLLKRFLADEIGLEALRKTDDRKMRSDRPRQ